MTGKLKLEFFNFARELNLSGWRFLFLSILRRMQGSKRFSKAQKLEQISGMLAHFPANLIVQRKIPAAIELSVSINEAVSDSKPVSLGYCFVVKPFVSESEKGLLLISFENQLAALLDSGSIKEVLARYHIIFIPSWTGLYSPELFRLTALVHEDPLFILPVHAHERGLVPTLGKNCHPLPFNAASWVNASFFEGPPLERDIDCLMVANFASFKRHWLLFKALNRLPDSVKATCVGIPLGSRTAASIRHEAQEYGVADRVTVVEDPSQEELRRYFRRAKVFCAMSYREGSFISVAEALMAGTPVLMFRNAHIGTKSLVNGATGSLVDSVADLANKILAYQNYSDHDSVRQTSIETISAQANSRKLNDMISALATRSGREWTQDLEPFYSQRLDFHYLNERARDRLRPDYEYLSTLGIHFPSFS